MAIKMTLQAALARSLQSGESIATWGRPFSRGIFTYRSQDHLYSTSSGLPILQRVNDIIGVDRPARFHSSLSNPHNALTVIAPEPFNRSRRHIGTASSLKSVR